MRKKTIIQTFILVAIGVAFSAFIANSISDSNALFYLTNNNRRTWVLKEIEVNQGNYINSIDSCLVNSEYTFLSNLTFSASTKCDIALGVTPSAAPFKLNNSKIIIDNDTSTILEITPYVLRVSQKLTTDEPGVASQAILKFMVK